MSPFPADAVDTITSALSAGQIISRRSQIGAALASIFAWIFASGVLAGREAVAELGDEVEAKLHDLLEALHATDARLESHRRRCCQYYGATPEQQDTATPVAIDPATITTIVTLIQTLGPMIMQLLQWIHDRRHPAPTPTPTATA